MRKDMTLRRNTIAALAMGSTLVLAGCRQDMQNQPREFPQRSTTMFADGRSSREQVAGTIARSQGDRASYMLTGLVDGKPSDTLPVPVTAELLARGQERYNIYCTACHSRVGNGGGEIVQRGYRPAGNFHTDRMRAQPLSHFFDVMTNGYGAMPDYSAQLTPEDRWAVAAYIRALQLSQHASPADVKSGEKIEKLGDIAAREGLPANFAAEWELPSTAVYGTPNKQDNGIPGQDSTSTKSTATPAASTRQNTSGNVSGQTR